MPGSCLFCVVECRGGACGCGGWLFLPCFFDWAARGRCVKVGFKSVVGWITGRGFGWFRRSSLRVGASHPSTSSGEPLSLKSVPPAHFARPPQMPCGGGMGGLVLAAARKAPASLRSRPPKCRRPTCSPMEVLVPRRCHAMKLNHPNPLFLTAQDTLWDYLQLHLFALIYG